MSRWIEGDQTWLSPAMQRTIELMQAGDLIIRGSRTRKGHLRYVLSNNEVLRFNLVDALKARGLLEQIESTEEANAKNEVHYRLKVK